MSALLIMIGAILVFIAVLPLFFDKCHAGMAALFALGALFVLHGLFFDTLLPFFAAFMVVYVLFVVWLIVLSMFFIVFAFKNASLPCYFDVILVLGCGIKGCILSRTLKLRLNKAMEFKKTHSKAKLMLSGGMSKGADISEAHAMRKYLVKKGLSEDTLMIEDEALSTFENFAFSTALIGDKKVLAVTSVSHTYRAYLMARAAGLDIRICPAKEPLTMFFTNYIRELIAVTMFFMFGRIV